MLILLVFSRDFLFCRALKSKSPENPSEHNVPLVVSYKVKTLANLNSTLQWGHSKQSYCSKCNHDVFYIWVSTWTIEPWLFSCSHSQSKSRRDFGCCITFLRCFRGFLKISSRFLETLFNYENSIKCYQSIYWQLWYLINY